MLLSATGGYLLGALMTPYNSRLQRMPVASRRGTAEPRCRCADLMRV